LLVAEPTQTNFMRANSSFDEFYTAYLVNKMTFSLKHKNLQSFDLQVFVFFDIEISGAGGIRTLVQTWYKVSFLRA
jgi:hypothetical protein